jgi:integrase
LALWPSIWTPTSHLSRNRAIPQYRLSDPAGAGHPQHKKHPRPLVGFLIRPELDALLSAPNKNTWLGRRDHALLLTTVQTGLRLPRSPAFAKVTSGSVSVLTSDATLLFFSQTLRGVPRPQGIDSCVQCYRLATSRTVTIGDDIAHPGMVSKP